MIRRSRGESGAATAELAVATPLLLLLLMFVVQFALWEHASHVASVAAREGVRSARLADGTSYDGQQKANQLLAQLGSSTLVSPDISVTRDATTVRVDVKGYAEEVVPGVHLPVRASSQGQIEQFRGSAQ